MLVALKPIYDAVGISRINVATYQAVSGSGKEAITELTNQTANLLNGNDVEVEVYTKQIAFNAIPHIDTFQDNGYTREEMKMVWETQKIFEDDNLLVNPTAVRIPVVYGHSEAVHIETKEKITAIDARNLLEKAEGVIVIDERKDGGYATPFVEATNTDATYVSRIREDISHDKGLNLWVVSDNIRKGAALNSIQIAEILIRDYIA
jgi:aspartate-semialdehyde dehydrogenase